MGTTCLKDGIEHLCSVLRTYWVVVLLGCAVYGMSASTSALANGSVSPGQTFQLALEAQTNGHYDEMLTLLRSAAGANHLPAQEMLGMALLVGPTLYGDGVKADRCEAGQWIRRALAQGSDVARYQWAFMGRVRQAPAGSAPCDIVAG